MTGRSILMAVARLRWASVIMAAIQSCWQTGQPILRNVKYPRLSKQSVQHLSANRPILAYRAIKSARCLSVQKHPLTLNHVLDAYYNPLKVDNSQLQVVSEKGSVTGSGLSYTAVKAGEDRVTVQYGNAKQSFPVTVVDAPAKLTIAPSTTKVKPGETVSYKATATDAQGKTIIYSPEQLEWSVTGDIGTITQSGSFKAANKAGKGSSDVKLGYENDKHAYRIVGRSIRIQGYLGYYAYYTEIIS